MRESVRPMGIESQKLEPEQAQGSGGVHDYDLANQERIVRGRMPTMEIVNELACRARLSALLAIVLAMRRLLLCLLGLGFLLAAASACNNDCDFYSRCNGNTLEVCGEGPDQQFNRRVSSTPCEGPNATCVEHDGRASCVHAPATSCDASFTPACDQSIALTCDRDFPFVVAHDCASRTDGKTTCAVSTVDASTSIECRAP